MAESARPTHRFEDALHDLEDTVQRLESGEVSLEMPGRFRRGVCLVSVLKLGRGECHGPAHRKGSSSDSRNCERRKLIAA